MVSLSARLKRDKSSDRSTLRPRNPFSLLPAWRRAEAPAGPTWPTGAILELVQGATPPPGFMLIGTYQRELRPPFAIKGKGDDKGDDRGEIKLRIYVYQKK